MLPNTISPTATVYVVDDDQAARRSVVSLIREMGLAARPFSSAEQFLEADKQDGTCCLVTADGMLGMSGIELLEKLLADGIGIPAIVITAYAETPWTVRAMKNGAFTVLDKPCRNSELWDAIRMALAADEANRDRRRHRREVQRCLAQLTPDERQVLDLILLGKPNKVIARDLNLGLRTTEVRRQQIFRKMRAHSVAELVRLVIEAETGATLPQQCHAK